MFICDHYTQPITLSQHRLFIFQLVKLTLARSLEKEAHNKHLQPGHGHHHHAFNNTEIEDASLGAAHSTKVAVLARTEVFLVSGNRGQHGRHFHDRLFDNTRLFGTGALLGWQLCLLLVFDLWICASAHIQPASSYREHPRWKKKKKKTYRNLKIHKLLRKRRHFIAEAEAILANALRGKHEIALALLCSIQNDLFEGTGDQVVNVERAARLDLHDKVKSASNCRRRRSEATKEKKKRRKKNPQQSKKQPWYPSAAHQRKSTPSRWHRPCTSTPSRKPEEWPWPKDHSVYSRSALF